MKKISKILIALLLVIVALFGITGCNGTVYYSETVKGSLYTFQQAYDMGYLTREDVMSIAYYYYDGRKYNEGIMSEDYAPQPKIPEEINKNMAAEIKQAYLEQKAEFPEGDKDLVHISYYYGTYNGNIAVSIHSSYVCFDPIIEEEFYLGGVLFKNFWPGAILVYHIN